MCKTGFCNFWHSGTLALSPERQSARLSKITSDSLTRSVTGCIAVPIIIIIIKKIIIIIHRQFLTRRNTTKSLQGRASTKWLMTCHTEIVVSRHISVRSCQWWRGKTWPILWSQPLLSNCCVTNAVDNSVLSFLLDLRWLCYVLCLSVIVFLSLFVCLCLSVCYQSVHSWHKPVSRSVLHLCLLVSFDWFSYDKQLCFTDFWNFNYH